jgi:hypothetical protein
MAANKTYFKIFASMGPSGSILQMMEKVCRRVFNEAYTLGDEEAFSTPEEEEIRELRQEFVNELFNTRGKFLRRINDSVNIADTAKAYMELHVLIERYRRKITKLEKQRINKERTFYFREDNTFKYD